MQKYYHNTTATNPNNVLYAYLSAEGDLLLPEDNDLLLPSQIDTNKNDGAHILAKYAIIVEAGLLAACPLQEFERNLARKAREHFNI